MVAINWWCKHQMCHFSILAFLSRTSIDLEKPAPQLFISLSLENTYEYPTPSVCQQVTNTDRALRQEDVIQWYAGPV